jgi:hypothetical protein
MWSQSAERTAAQMEEQADVYQSAWRLEQADVYEADTEQTEAERTERARHQYLSHYERRQALPEVFP